MLEYLGCMHLEALFSFLINPFSFLFSDDGETRVGSLIAGPVPQECECYNDSSKDRGRTQGFVAIKYKLKHYGGCGAVTRKR